MTDQIITETAAVTAPDDPLTRGVAMFTAGAPGKLLRTLARTASYNKRGLGSAEHRRCILPGETIPQWVSEAGETEGDYSRGEGADYTYLPEGTIVLAFSTETTKYGKGRASLSAGVVVEWQDEAGKKMVICWGLTVRRRGDVPIVTLPDGTKLTF